MFLFFFCESSVLGVEVLDKLIDVLVDFCHRVYKIVVGLVIVAYDTLVSIDTRLVLPNLLSVNRLVDYCRIGIVVDVLEPVPANEVLALKKS